MCDARLTAQLDSKDVSEINSIFSVHVGMYVDREVKYAVACHLAAVHTSQRRTNYGCGY